jgi:hypothetical protein
MRILIRTVPWHEQRHAWAQELQDAVGGELVLDENHNGYSTFLKALRVQGEAGAWHLEDDIILTARWTAQAKALAFEHGRHIIQAWDARKANAEKGPGFRAPNTYYGQLCFWIPPGLAPRLADWCEAERARREKYWHDVAMQDYMRAHRMRYWQHTPSLVQHRQSPSLVGPRSSQRLSPSFVP